MKKMIIFSLALCTAFGMSGCAKSDTGSSTAETADLTADNTKSITELTDKVDLLAKALSDLGGIDYDDFWDTVEETGTLGTVHEIYDDTAVVEAYKSGDSSKLTDEKDLYIYDSLVKAVDEIITDDMSDYDKELAVYNYMFDTTHFNYDSLSAITDTETEDYSHTPYGFFHDHSTICVGNATTFKLFMDVLGIDCQIIHSTEEGEHAWNIVKIDGDWYHCDLTFDGGNQAPDYAYFNVPDSAKLNSGYPWDTTAFPECNSYKYCYAFQNAAELADVYEIPKAISDGIADGKNTIYMKYKLGENENQYVVTSQLTSILDSITMTADMGYGYSGTTMAIDDYVLVSYVYTSAENISDMTDTYTTDDGALDIDYGKLSEAFDSDLEGFTFYYDGAYTDYSGSGTTGAVG